MKELEESYGKLKTLAMLLGATVLILIVFQVRQSMQYSKVVKSLKEHQELLITQNAVMDEAIFYSCMYGVTGVLRQMQFGERSIMCPVSIEALAEVLEDEVK